MRTLRTAVIGVGYLGRFHAQKYASIEGSELVGVSDNDPERCRQVAEEVSTTGYTSYRELLDKVDAVSIVVPTTYHFQVAREFLERGVHVLVEKPITVTIQEANELIALARENGAVLQVGHLERFNPAITALDGVLHNPRFIESQRLAPFKPRATDVSVILDLMIHDIDLIQSIVRSPVKTVSSVGAPVFTEEADIANARIVFENGCVANVTASRISMKSERKIRFFQEDAYISSDLQNRHVAIFRRGEGETAPGIPAVAVEQHSFEQADALRSEIEAFLTSVREGKPPVVSGEDGRTALETALRITEKL